MESLLNSIKMILIVVLLSVGAAVMGAAFSAWTFMVGWQEGMKQLVTDYGLLTGAELFGNEYILYMVTIGIMMTVITIYTKMTDKTLETIFWYPLFFINVFGAAVMVAAPYFYNFYVHGGAKFVA